MLYPKLFTTLKTYNRAQFFADVSAGVIVGIVALPLAIAFAIASGVSPDRGLVTAVVAGFLISFLGGSRVQIGGPTGAFIVIVYAIVQKHGVNGLVVSMLMAGVMMILMGVARLGGVIKFIPYPVTVGFTSGIALIIFSSQMRDLFGLSTESLPAEFIEKWTVYFHSMHTFNPYAFILGLGTIVLIQFWRKISVKVPGPLVALIATSAAVHYFHLPVETIASRFGEIPHTLPMPMMPQLSMPLIRELTSPAITIALLASIESLLSAVVADGMIGGRHRSNMELVAQGVANIASALFGGMPATGAIARTTTNVHNGGRTPVAGIVHALTLLLIMMFFGKWAGLVPLSCLAGILIIVAYHMSEWRSFVMVLRSPRSDVMVLLITFSLTVLVDLTVAIEVGMVMAA
ncbi:MAG: sodium-independent anion transporter, partial [Candidatus Omnitrophica bacterium]|nr:sodium-independent anion transporter [Candidatus Omnitrophota bacterium]